MDKDDIAADVVAACEKFLGTWDRHEWMQTFGEWTSDGEDHIEAGTIEEEDYLADECEDLGIGVRETGWECTEGWDAYRDGNALVIKWWRVANRSGVRHDRDLWVVVDDEFFEGE